MKKDKKRKPPLHHAVDPDVNPVRLKRMIDEEEKAMADKKAGK